ncbi:MAG: hypothetical protein A3D26_02910 [Candidatus Blackburnbacteria bacterium RIFCSPHIGHO2_02_FULL_44_20]|uniref:Uncharacterized protein n=1 Tax=Candidatus Blackburnbacteria bacterium RIFCSPHIGHO2_02_FULL_44_20 TaxID=1797516 RepID=A0A1G1V5V2_9BACT|nr:MAG: hypothetical protein A3D26_02910 [Candidatus Blackburnbacteria bacterium RIFCSPHIGHO2_02_FULL_44_20]OGY11879.1 MAG: hypothetical protein A3E16_03760 [Candidatus Blackburnbacteria bacterium RIFCSPHIGHO2_12_FULL_44_25]
MLYFPTFSRLEVRLPEKANLSLARLFKAKLAPIKFAQRNAAMLKLFAAGSVGFALALALAVAFLTPPAVSQQATHPASTENSRPLLEITREVKRGSLIVPITSTDAEIYRPGDKIIDHIVVTNPTELHLYQLWVSGLISSPELEFVEFKPVWSQAEDWQLEFTSDQRYILRYGAGKHGFGSRQTVAIDLVFALKNVDRGSTPLGAMHSVMANLGTNRDSSVLVGSDIRSAAINKRLGIDLAGR